MSNLFRQPARPFAVRLSRAAYRLSATAFFALSLVLIDAVQSSSAQAARTTTVRAEGLSVTWPTPDDGSAVVAGKRISISVRRTSKSSKRPVRLSIIRLDRKMRAGKKTVPSSSRSGKLRFRLSTEAGATY